MVYINNRCYVYKINLYGTSKKLKKYLIFLDGNLIYFSFYLKM